MTAPGPVAEWQLIAGKPKKADNPPSSDGHPACALLGPSGDVLQNLVDTLNKTFNLRRLPLQPNVLVPKVDGLNLKLSRSRRNVSAAEGCACATPRCKLPLDDESP